ncbi:MULTISPECIES: LAGLIDADG family homing endonuclease [unclassified Streptomyces]|uniref:LAGLIDADG family homing endonuclease n=1 Tax=unclassified Streptomyces TaxID=2593676 RepID=UPI0011A172F2|nr:LAGLIDADG family homing endonuclease [Streptomyces sp. BK340]TVZ99122.1 intein [Streptomyces sp. BK340]
MSNFEGLAEGTPVWLPDGTVVPVERVVTEKLPVLAFDKEWDLREAKPGRPYPPRDNTVGNLVPVLPVRWISNGTQPVFAVRLASGRMIEATANHRWAVRSREGSRRPTWKATTHLVPGCAVPAPLTADFFGALGDEWDGWFVGSMLGDGNMTGRTPTWVGHDDGTLQQIRDYATKRGCQARVEDNGTWLRVRLTDPEWHRNALRDLLIEHQVWGLKGEEKRVATLPYSRAFVCGLVAGLFDSDGSVEARQIEFANTSEALVRQLGDALLRLGVQSNISSKRNNHSPKPLWRLRVADGRSVVRLSETVRLRAEHKAAALESLAARRRPSRRSATGSRGYADAIVWDRIVSLSATGVKKAYCVEGQPSDLWIANGVVTGN